MQSTRRAGGPPQRGGRKLLHERLADECEVLEEKRDKVLPLVESAEAEAESLEQELEARQKEADGAVSKANEVTESYLTYVQKACEEYNGYCDEVNAMHDELKGNKPKVLIRIWYDCTSCGRSQQRGRRRTNRVCV